MTPSLRLNAPVTPRPAYLWFLVGPEVGILAVCGYTRTHCIKSANEGSGVDYKLWWRRMYRRGARVMRCKVSVSLEHSP